MTDNQNMAGDEQTYIVDQKEFASKFRTKGENWRFLATDVGAYIPPMQTVTIWHLKDLADGVKKVSKSRLLTLFYSKFVTKTSRSSLFHSTMS